MNIKIIRIGNSKGIRIPKEILSQCQMTDRVDLKTKGNKIILESFADDFLWTFYACCVRVSVMPEWLDE